MDRPNRESCTQENVMFRHCITEAQRGANVLRSRIDSIAGRLGGVVHERVDVDMMIAPFECHRRVGCTKFIARPEPVATGGCAAGLR